MRPAVIASALLLAGCAPAPAERGFLFECPGLGNVVARYRNDEALIALSGRRLSLPRAISGSGARYARGSAQFWEKGGIATVDLDGRTYPDCKHNPARDPA
ncbi:MAG: lysozyme inhibitor [Alphaproteobacteria bacterium]|nr:lysozyme inhibitor [Alphaproteobacteria bacterium]